VLLTESVPPDTVGEDVAGLFFVIALV